MLGRLPIVFLCTFSFVDLFLSDDQSRLVSNSSFESNSLGATVVPVLNKTNSSVDWSSNQVHHPPISTQCQLRPIHWGNFSSAQAIHLSAVEVDRFFRLPMTNRRRPAAVRRTCKSPNNCASLYAKPHVVQCHVLYIYSPDCPYSLAAFPYIRALARAYPQLHLFVIQVDDYSAHRWSLRIMFVPKLKVFIDGRIAREYSGSDTDLHAMIDFVWQTTHQLPNGPIGLSPHDFSSIPFISPTGPNMTLVASWCSTIFCILYVCCLYDHSIRQFVSKLLYRVSGGRFGCISVPVMSTLSTVDTD